MCSDELPQQKVYEVAYLLQEPLEFQASCLMRCGTRDDRDDYAWSLSEADLPQHFPGAATFVAQVEWAWSSHNARLDAYYICSNRKRTHWFLWIRSPDDNAWDFRMNSLLYAYCHRRKVDQKTAATYLLLQPVSATQHQANRLVLGNTSKLFYMIYGLPIPIVLPTSFEGTDIAALRVFAK